MKNLAICFMFLWTTSICVAQTYNIKDYGAVNDGITLNTLAIQKAIDASAAKGDGIVYVPPGKYITGTIALKSNVDFRLEIGAVLKGSSNIRDYKSYVKETYGTNNYGILYTDNAENVVIIGNGKIDGNDKVFFDWDHAKKIDSVTNSYTRQKQDYRKVTSSLGDGPIVPIESCPRQMVIFAQCQKATVNDVMLANATFWTLHIADCDAVKIDGIRLWSSLLVPNADGIDITSSFNVVIANSDIRTGDDAIAVVSYYHHFEIPGYKGIKRDCENIIISNCNLQSTSSAIRIGFLDQNNVRNIQINNINITNSNRGIGIFVRDEGSVENINISNVYIQTKLKTGDWWGKGEPIHISAVRGNPDVKLGQIKNVNFSNIICEEENGILVYGSDESTIENLCFKNVTFKITDSKLNNVASGNIDLRGKMYAQRNIFSHDIPTLYASKVKELTIDDFKLQWDTSLPSFFTNGILVNDFKNLKINNFQGSASPSNSALKSITLKDGFGFKSDVDKSAVQLENVK